MKKKGSITVFLVLMLSIISAFIIELSTAVRSLLAKSEAAYAMDAAVRSCFAEYNRELFERFHILLIDSSYKSPDSGPERVKSHFEAYLEGSITENGICHVEISECADASADNCRYLYDMAVKYAKNNMSIDHRLTGTDDKAYFITYLTGICGNGERYPDRAVRAGEIEYLLYGYEEDEDNLNRAFDGYYEYSEYEEYGYEDYLCKCLEEEDIILLRQRFGELVTEYVRANGSPGFDTGSCYYSLTFYADLNTRIGDEYNITRQYAYESEDA